MPDVIAPPAPVEPAAAVEPPAPPAEPVAPPPAAPDDVASLPEWTQKLIKDLRTEAATNRTKATTEAQSRQETMDAIAKALGLKGDDDPAKAAQTAAEEREAAKAVAKNLAVENAVLRMAAKQGANPDALTDSRSFMRQLEAIDPADAEFAAKVEEAIKAAVIANPALKSAAPAPAAPARSGGPVGGGVPIPGQWTEEDLVGKTPDEIAKAKADGLLKTLLSATQ